MELVWIEEDDYFSSLSLLKHLLVMCVDGFLQFGYVQESFSVEFPVIPAFLSLTLASEFKVWVWNVLLFVKFTDVLAWASL
jgi:hypothetical protein